MPWRPHNQRYFSRAVLGAWLNRDDKKMRQLLFTAHNPAVLDSLDLQDDEIRLFAVDRNSNGHTRIHRIVPTDKLAALLPRSFVLTLIQPEPTRPELGGGWCGVLKWCREFQRRGYGALEDDPTLLFDVMILHLDADVADKSYADITSRWEVVRHLCSQADAFHRDIAAVAQTLNP